MEWQPVEPAVALSMNAKADIAEKRPLIEIVVYSANEGDCEVRVSVDARSLGDVHTVQAIIAREVASTLPQLL